MSDLNKAEWLLAVSVRGRRGGEGAPCDTANYGHDDDSVSTPGIRARSGKQQHIYVARFCKRISTSNLL